LQHKVQKSVDGGREVDTVTTIFFGFGLGAKRKSKMSIKDHTGSSSKVISTLGSVLAVFCLLPLGVQGQTMINMVQNWTTNWSLADLWSGGVPPGGGVALDDIANLARAYGNGREV
jgi:hypothetical protein